MAKDKPPFGIIPGGLETPDKTRKPPTRQWTCKVCLADTGVATSSVMKMLIAPRVDQVRRQLVGGTEGQICVHCLARGKVTPAW